MYIYIYILKLVTFVDTFDSNVSWIYKHKEKFTTHSPILWDNRHNSDAYSFWKMGGHPALINQDHFFHFVVTTNKASKMNKVNK